MNKRKSIKKYLYKNCLGRKKTRQKRHRNRRGVWEDTMKTRQDNGKDTQQIKYDTLLSDT